ncbi:MAG TPA: carbonic anhydrase [Candidatus Margulisiibacteriota bacterium]|nr:carbonic anhydrase [Candidatus Margulisiibacteriota bacterium]
MTASPSKTPHVSADEALQRLIDGNQRFLRGESRFPTRWKDFLALLTSGQHPFATIIGCSDSRVPPELLFDAGFGELFVVRVAGNVVSPEVTGSMQYAGVHLHTPLFVVLGHEGCGAVQAALAMKRQGVRERSRIQILIDDMLPGLGDVDPQASPTLQLTHAVEANVRWSMRQLLEMPEAQARMAEGEMKLVGAVFDIASGSVSFLS